MEVTVESVIEHNSSCNFCNKGTIMKNRIGLSYPYDFVYTFKRENGSGLKASICPDCLIELHKKAAEISFNS